jgi:hypothetical protein
MNRATRTALTLASASASPVEHREPRRLRAQPGEVRGGPLDGPVGMLERSRGRQDEDLVGAREIEQTPVEVGAGLRPLVAADEGDGSGSLGHAADPLFTQWILRAALRRRAHSPSWPTRR